MNKLVYTALLFALLALPSLLAQQQTSTGPNSPNIANVSGPVDMHLGDLKVKDDPLAPLRSDIAIAQRDYFVALKEETDAVDKAHRDAKAKQDQLTQILMARYSAAQSACTKAHLGDFDPGTIKCKPAGAGAAGGTANGLPPAQVPNPPPVPNIIKPAPPIQPPAKFK